MPPPRLPRWLGVLALVAATAGALAQPGPPEFVAPPGSAQALPVPGAIDTQQLSHDAVELFRQTCAAPDADRTALIDRALNAGLQPYGSEGDRLAQALLGGASGQIFAPAGQGHLLQLALGDDGRCTVWAQQAEGPRVKAGFMALIEELRGQGARVSSTRDRVIQRAGGWRQQTGFEIAEPRGPRAFDAVTLVSERPGVQVLSTAPAAAAR